MKTVIDRANTRGHADYGWLNTCGILLVLQTIITHSGFISGLYGC